MFVEVELPLRSDLAAENGGPVVHAVSIYVAAANGSEKNWSERQCMVGAGGIGQAGPTGYTRSLPNRFGIAFD